MKLILVSPSTAVKTKTAHAYRSVEPNAENAVKTFETLLDSQVEEKPTTTALCDEKWRHNSHVELRNPALCDEFVGPVAMFFRVQDEESAISLANDLDYRLGGSVFTEDNDRGKRSASRIDTGMMFVNNIS
jgi:hypothetical protein